MVRRKKWCAGNIPKKKPSPRWGDATLRRHATIVREVLLCVQLFAVVGEAVALVVVELVRAGARLASALGTVRWVLAHVILSLVLEAALAVTPVVVQVLARGHGDVDALAVGATGAGLAVVHVLAALGHPVLPILACSLEVEGSVLWHFLKPAMQSGAGQALELRGLWEHGLRL